MARMYSGTAGRVPEYCQIGVFLGYATACGRTFLDRERRAQVRVEEAVEFATKPEVAMTMIARALDAAVPAAGVTGDEVYGQHNKLRMMLEGRGMPDVLAVAVNQRVIAGVDGPVVELRADTLAAMLPTQAWVGFGRP